MSWKQAAMVFSAWLLATAFITWVIGKAAEQDDKWRV